MNAAGQSRGTDRRLPIWFAMRPAYDGSGIYRQSSTTLQLSFGLKVLMPATMFAVSTPKSFS